MEKKKYYLGLDIGTDSVGYAVTDEYYNILKFKGEPAWGTHTFDAAETSAGRRMFRSARRRIDRRQQRVQLVNEIFAPEICKKDPRFFIRRMESSLLQEDKEDNYAVFEDGDFTDKEYYKKYPTIHHLICDIMNSGEPHDIRLVYVACAWLVAHRGHFLFDIDNGDIGSLLDFGRVYSDFKDYFVNELGIELPWNDSVTADDIKAIMTMKAGVTKKQNAFKENIYGGKAPSKTVEPDYPVSREAIVKLLCGAKIKPEDVFQREDYAEVDSLSLGMDDENFTRIVSELGEDGELFIVLRKMYDCSMLCNSQNGKNCISEAKIAVYDQHASDLKKLKTFVKEYIPQEYDSIFRDETTGNYASYSYNVKSCGNPGAVKKCGADDFGAFIKKKLPKADKIKPEDMDFYNDMLARIDIGEFMPKQKTSDNRVIPQQLYRYELESILKNATAYLPMLSKKDNTGLTAAEKILSIFDFRIPYFVGPLCGYKNANCWIERKATGKIYPWNFKNMVDFDKCETAFIRRMTNKCTYLAGEDVLPAKSLLYSKYTVLNEINNLKINGNPIPVEEKQRIFTDLFMVYPRVTLKKIKECLMISGCWHDGDELSGVDIKINSSLSSYIQFKEFIESGKLSEAQVEDIINRAAYTEDRARMIKWMNENYPALSKEDTKKISGYNLKGFGRLSREFLTGIDGMGSETTGEACSIIDVLWITNNNLMQLLSDNYEFKSAVENANEYYYSEHPKSLSDRLDEMYVSNAVKRPIYRTLDICGDVVKAFKGQPNKIFIEMARGASPDQKGRTKTRKQQLLELYKLVKTDEAKEFAKEIESLGDMADNRLQSDRLFLYYLQMGKSAYTGKQIDLTSLGDSSRYNIEHIYPRAFVKDDSIINNLVLVESEINGQKSNVFPVSSDIQAKMKGTWRYWLDIGVISKEKYERLTRTTPFSDDEKWQFINRQLVETRQSTKAVATILKEKYPDAEIVYVKAGLVSEFRQAFDMLKSRQVNNLHHAKDAYLNIVVGNVYNFKFNKNWFIPDNDYSIKTEKVFSKPVKFGQTIVWQGETDIARIKAIAAKNNIHCTRYAYIKKGGLFDVNPKKAKEDLIPLKKNMPTEKYGGYNGASVVYFSLVKYTLGKKTDIVFMPVEIMIADKCLEDKGFAYDYLHCCLLNKKEKEMVKQKRQDFDSFEVLLDGRPIKIKSQLYIDGLIESLNGKYDDNRIQLSLSSPLIVDPEMEKYIKKLESFKNKQKSNSKILLDAEYDGISRASNLALYDCLTDKMENSLFKNCKGNFYDKLIDKRDKFTQISVDSQVTVLLNIIMWFNPSMIPINLKNIELAENEGKKNPSCLLSSWKEKYSNVRIIDSSASGLYSNISVNLLSLL